MSWVKLAGIAGVLMLASLWPLLRSQAEQVHEGQTSASSSAAMYVGALAWLEPKSRIIKLGAPNVFEGARVEELYIQEGDRVQKGQSVGVFSTYAKNKAALDVAEASYALAQASLERVSAGNKKSDIISQQQIVQSLKAGEAAAAQEFKRIESLYQEKLAAKSQYDAIKAERNRLVAERKSAEATLTSLENVRPDDIEIAKAQVAVAKSELDVAKANVDLSTIVAPIDGTVLTVYARNGEAVGDLGVLDIANLDVIDAVAEVDENDILKIKMGQKAEIDGANLGHPVSGVVREIGGQIKRNSLLDSDPSQILDTRIVEIRIELDKSANEEIKRLINKKVRAKIFP